MYLELSILHIESQVPLPEAALSQAVWCSLGGHVRFRLSSTTLSAVLLALLAACTRGPAVPALESFGALDPDVSALVAEQLTSLREMPGDANRWGVLAMTLEANGLTPPATQAYTTATTFDASHGRWWYHLARMRARDGDTEGALAAYDRAIAISPDYVPARWRKGLVLLDRGDLDAADAAFRVALNLSPRDAAALTGVARVAIARGRFGEAVEQLTQRLDTAPADRYAYQLLATAYRGLGRTRDAEDAGAAGASGEPEFADAWADEVGVYRRGFAAMLKDATALGLAGRTDEAIQLLERLRNARPEDRELRTYLGGMYATAGRFDDAARVLDDVLQRHPDDFDAVVNLASAHLFAKRYDEADRLVARALVLRSGDTDATRLRGVVAWRAGRLDDAERLLAEAAAANTKDAKAYGWIGDIRRERGRHASALTAYRQALARDPLLVDALVGGASCALSTGDRADAAAWIGRAKRLAPGHARLADVEHRLGEAAK